MDKFNTWWLGAMFWGLFSSVALILAFLSTWDRFWFGGVAAIVVTFGFYGIGLLVKRTAKVWFDMEEAEAK
jgi:hypothetical protein